MTKENGTVNYLNVFITVVLALAFITAIASLTLQTTTTTLVTDEVVNLAPARLAAGGINTTYPITIANPPTGWQTNTRECDIAGVVYGNSSTNYALTTDYTFTATTGVLLLKNTVTVNNSVTNTTYIDYKYCGPGYVESSWARTVLNTNVGLYAMAILIIVVALVYLLLNRKGQDD